jgi:hypothetical protein
MPASEGISKLAGSEEKRLGIPEATKFFSCGNFGSMNQTDARTAIEDSEFFIVENFLLTGRGSLRTIYDQGAAVYTAPSGLSIIYFSWFNINADVACAVFLSDGTAVQVAYPTYVVTPISAMPGTFYNATQLPVACQWGDLFLLIANNITPNTYWIWDGSVLYAAGGIGPFQLGDLTSGGTNYTSPPDVIFYGGAGSGAAATATIENGSVTALTVTNPGTGYTPADQVAIAFVNGGSDGGAVLTAILSSSGVDSVVILGGGSGYTTAPTVTFSGGGGQFAAGSANILDGAVVSVTVTTSGTGYTSPPTVTLTGGRGSGAAAAAVLAISGVSSIDVVTAGHGYTSAPTVTISGGGGSGATAVATLTNGGVSAITVTNEGSAYTGTPTVSFSGGGGTGAAGVAQLTVASISGVTIVYGGSGYVGTPQLTFVGGGGSGATATALVTGGTISSIEMTAAGSGYTSAPTVQIQAGVNNAASGTIALMPFGVSGTSIETFQSRVWISNPAEVGPITNGGVINISAPESLTDFATSAGGDLFTSNDRFLRKQYVALHQSNGYLYTLADSSVSNVSNVQTSGSPPSTTFNYYNTHAQIGAAWRDTVQDFGQTILFGNANGINAIYGGAVTRASKKMDDLFANAVFPPAAGAVTPSAAVANIYTIPVYLMNMTIRDPQTQALRTVMVAWNEKEWFLVSQKSSMTFIATLEVASVMSAWGTDGHALYPLMTTPSGLQKRLVTKLWGGEREYIIKQPLVDYIRATDKSAGQEGVSFTVTMESAGLAQQIGQAAQLPSVAYVNPVQPNFLAPNYTAPVWGGQTAAVAGTALGATITTNSPDVLISGISFAYRDDGFLFG